MNAFSSRTWYVGSGAPSGRSEHITIRRHVTLREKHNTEILKQYIYNLRTQINCLSGIKSMTDRAYLG